MRRASRSVRARESSATIIGKDGSVQELKLISGPQSLVQAAIDAVKQWHYQTTIVNAEPVEVATQIDVNFTLNQ